MSSVIRIGFFSSSDFTLPILENMLIRDYTYMTLGEIVKQKHYNFTYLGFAIEPKVDLTLFDNLLLDTTIELAFVATQPDRELRGKTISNPVATFARERNIPCITPHNINKEIEQYADLIASVDVIIVASYGQIISQKVLDLPRYGFINWHPSLLPQYRGATPMQSALKDNESVTGLTWIQMTKGMDSGDILVQLQCSLLSEDGDDFNTLAASMGDKGVRTWGIAVALQLLAKHNLFKPRVQDESQATYCGMLSKDDALINPLEMSAHDVDAHVRAYIAFPGTKYYSEYFGSVVKIVQITYEAQYANPIKQIENPIYQSAEWVQTKQEGVLLTYLVCKDGYVRVKKIVLENGKQIDLSGFLMK